MVSVAPLLSVKTKLLGSTVWWNILTNNSMRQSSGFLVMLLLVAPSLSMDFGGSGVWDSPMATDSYVRQVVMSLVSQLIIDFHSLVGCLVVVAVGWKG